MRPCIFICLALSLAVAAADSKVGNPDLLVEHRSASPEPFLDRLATALFGSGEKKKSDKRKPQRGGPKPVYKRPPIQQQVIIWDN